jgi:hypothetical protein
MIYLFTYTILYSLKFSFCSDIFTISRNSHCFNIYKMSNLGIKSNITAIFNKILFIDIFLKIYYLTY